MLSGWKSYIVMGLGIIVNGCYAMGLIPAEYITIINSILAFLGLGAIRSAIGSK